MVKTSRQIKAQRPYTIYLEELEFPGSLEAWVDLLVLLYGSLCGQQSSVCQTDH